MANILATGIKNQPHLKVFNDMAEQRFADLDMTSLLIYLVDTVPAAALEALAEQFDVLGWKGWALATTEQQRRDLIKQAIELHRFKGTPWAIKEAVKRIGFGGAEIVEGLGRFYDGSFEYNGGITYSGLNNWALFRVILDLGNDKGISADQTEQLEFMIEEYKNVRSHLVDITFNKNLTDDLLMEDEVLMTIEFATQVDAMSGILYDGLHMYNGEHTYNAYAEELTITT
jgi:P2-related tail formation protein